MIIRRFLSQALIATAITAMATFSSCQDADDTIGSALVENPVDLTIDSLFTLTGQSVLNPRIQSRTTTQLLGSIRAKGYGSLSGNYIVQMMPSVKLDASLTRENIDSVKLLLVFDRGGFVGDSLAPMGLKVYPLSKPLAEDDTIFSDFGSQVANYVDFNAPLAEGYYSAAYTAAGLGVSDTVAAAAYRYVYVPLPKEEAIKVYDAYQADSLMFNYPEEFARKVFPGYYVQSSFGSGRVTRITDTRWVVFFHNVIEKEKTDGTKYDSIVPYYGIYMASAPEVPSGSCITLTMDQSVNELADAGHAVMLSPAGRDVQVRFPLPEIISSYRRQVGKELSVINSLSLRIPASDVDNAMGITRPDFVLFVPSNQKDRFFARNMLPDNVTSFYGTYSEANGDYYFSDMRAYLTSMLDKYATVAPEDIPAEEYTFTITPISIVSESSNSYYYSTSYMSSVSPLVALPSMTELLLDKAKIKFSFSQQSPR